MLIQWLLASRIGRAIRALRSTAMAESFGVDVAQLKVQVFVFAALLAALSGWLYAHLQRFVNPTPFGLNMGIEYLFMAVVGGAGYVWGALAGSALITVLKEALQSGCRRTGGGIAAADSSRSSCSGCCSLPCCNTRARECGLG